jgi:aspartate/methionine/tyrosine aminotransferase
VTSVSRRAYALDSFTICTPLPSDRFIDLRADHRALVPVSVVQELQRASAQCDLGAYQDVQGGALLREALSERLEVPASMIVLTNGASEAIALAVLATADSGDTVALPRPAFPGYEQMCRLFGVSVEYYDVVPDSVTSRPLIDRSVRCIVATTPHVPTGYLHGDTYVEQLRGRVSLSTWLVRDVSHDETLLTKPLSSGLGSHTVHVLSLSKILRLPGLRVGVLVGSNIEFVSAILACKLHLSMAIGALSQEFLLRLLRWPGLEDSLSDQLSALGRSRHRVRSAILSSSSLRVVGGEAGSQLLVASRLPEAEPAIAERLRSRDVVGVPGAVFNSPFPSVRLSHGQPDALVDRACDALASM